MMTLHRQSAGAGSGLPVSEKERLLTEFTQTQAPYPGGETITALFERQVEKTPEATAIVYQGKVLTYAALNRRANQLAHYLQSKFRLRPDDLVGIMADRSPEMVIAMLGILKTGAAFVPIDKNYPDDRIRYVLEDAHLKALVMDNQIAGEVTSIYQDQCIILREAQAEMGQFSTDNPAGSHRATDLVYVIYTSGSTGKPKGVMIEHASLVNLCYWHRSAFGVNESSRSIIYAGPGFDASVWEIFPPLLCGASLYPVQDDKRLDLEALAQFFHEAGITHAFLPSAICMQLQQQDLDLPANIVLLTGGDRLKKVKNGPFNVVNNYGPTECTVVATSRWLPPDEPLGLVPIGKPIHNTRIYIVSDSLELLPLGSTGEICIAGDGLARGYLHCPELTAAKFVDNPFEPGRRMYRTGDLGRWTEEGQLAFEGRLDEQVKIRDYRIDPAEIEMAISQHPDVKGVVVTARQDGQEAKYLVAYVLSDAELKTMDLRTFLKSLLPAYMVPAYFVQLDQIPFTANGKIDKKALPAPESALFSASTYVAPGDETEEKMALIWSEVLEREQTGVLDNFFEIGGHSLKAMRIVSAIYREWQVRLSLQDVFQHPTVRSLSARLLADQSFAFEPIAPLQQLEADYEVSHAQKGLWMLDQFQKGTFTPNIAGAHIFEGLLNKNALKQAFDDVVARHESLRTTFQVVQGEPRQIIAPVSNQGHLIAYLDLRTDEQGEEKALQLANEEETKPFDLEKGPLLRTTLVQLAETRYVFLLTMHHIISDGWSVEILIHEVVRLYNAYLRGEPNTLTPLRIQYKDYSAWHNHYLRGRHLINLRQYWLGQLGGNLPPLQLPLDNPRPALKSEKVGFASLFLDNGIGARLKVHSQQQGATLFMSLVAAVGAFLSRCSGQHDLVMGTPVLGRDHPDLEEQIGIFTNTLALRLRLNDQESFETLLGKAKKVTLDGFKHQLYPFDCLIDDLNLVKDPSRSPLFDVMITLEDREMVGLATQEMEGITVSNLKTEGVSLSYDLLFHFKPIGAHLLLNLEYNADLFEEESIALMLDKWSLLLSGMVAEPQRPLRLIPLEIGLEKEMKAIDLPLEFNF